MTAVCAVQTSDGKIDSDVGVKFKRMLEARLRQLEQEKNREGGRNGGHAADAPAAPGVAWTEAEEAHLTRLVEQVRRAEGIVLGAGDWRRVALELVSRPVTHTHTHTRTRTHAQAHDLKRSESNTHKAPIA